MIKKKKQKYINKCKIIQDYINKVYFYFEKARQDGVITLEELEGFNKLIKEFDINLENKNSKEIDVNDKFDITTLKKEAELEAKKEIAVEMKEKFKKRSKRKIIIKCCFINLFLNVIQPDNRYDIYPSAPPYEC